MKLFSPFLILLLFLAAPTPKLTKHEKKLVGNWKVDSIDMSEMLNNLSEEEKAMYESFIPMMEEAFKTMTMTFNADGTMSTKAEMMGQVSTDDGTWKLSKDGKTLTTMNNAKQEEIKIEKLTKSELRLAFDADGMKLKLLFKKQ